MSRYLPLLLLLPLLGCAETETSLLDGDRGNVTDAVVGDFIYEINVYPSREANDPDALLPQSFAIEAGAAAGMALTLHRPVLLSGRIHGYLVTPRDTTLPGRDVPVGAEIGVLLPDTIQSRYSATNSEGEFAVSVVPGSTYDLVVRPFSADLPYLVQSVDIEQDLVIDLDLGPGVALWGQVLGPLGAPIVGAAVAAEDLFGVRSEPTLTDEDGRYLLRVQQGTYSVVVFGRDSGRDPVLHSPLTASGDLGSRIDLTYENLGLVTVGGRISADGAPIREARVRFTSESLEGYTSSGASLSVDAIANTAGNFDTRLVAGTYTIEVLPGSEQQVSYYREEGVILDGDSDLGTLVSAGYLAVNRRVFDDLGNPVEGAGIRCAEQVGDGRSITATSDVEGLLSVWLPQSEIACLVTPPGGSGTLAAARFEVDLSQDDLPSITLRFGATVSGSVRTSDNRPAAVAGALVEVRDSKGSLWGTTITDGSGQFSLQVAWPLP